MLLVTSLHCHAEHTSIHLLAIGRTVVVNSRDVATHLGYDGGNLHQFARFVVQLHLDGAETTALGETTIDDTVEDGYVDVTTADHTDGLLALHRYLVVHHGCYTGSTSTLSHHLLALDEFQDSCANLVLAHRHNLIDIVGASLEGDATWLLYGDAIGNGRD